MLMFKNVYSLLILEKGFTVYVGFEKLIFLIISKR